VQGGAGGGPGATGTQVLPFDASKLEAVSFQAQSPDGASGTGVNFRLHETNGPTFRDFQSLSTSKHQVEVLARYGKKGDTVGCRQDTGTDFLDAKMAMLITGTD